MKILSARLPEYTENGGIKLLVTFESLGEVPFHATPDDTEPHGRDLYARAMQGEFGVVEEHVTPPIPFYDLVEAKKIKVNEGKNQVLDGGFMYEGVLWDSDYKARLAYLELVTQLQMDPGFSTDWKASTGNWTTMNAAKFAAVTPVYRAHIQACFVWQAAREAEIAAAVALLETDEAQARAALQAIPETMN